MQVVEGGDGCSEVALGMVQLLYVPRNLLDLCRERNRSDIRWERKKQEEGKKSDGPRGRTHPLVWDIIVPTCFWREGLLDNPLPSFLFSPTITAFLWLSLTHTHTCNRQTHGRCITTTLNNLPLYCERRRIWTVSPLSEGHIPVKLQQTTFVWVCLCMFVFVYMPFVQTSLPCPWCLWFCQRAAGWRSGPLPKPAKNKNGNMKQTEKTHFILLYKNHWSCSHCLYSRKWSSQICGLNRFENLDPRNSKAWIIPLASLWGFAGARSNMHVLFIIFLLSVLTKILTHCMLKFHHQGV